MSTITIHSKPGCPYCERAKSFLQHKGLNFVEVIYDPADATYETHKNELISKTNLRTFPQIYIGTVMVGGYTDLVHLYNTMQMHEICKKELGIDLATAYDF